MPEAVLNYVALLGWTPRALEDINVREFKDEIFHLKELEKMVTFSHWTSFTNYCLVLNRKSCSFEFKTSREQIVLFQLIFHEKAL